MFFCVLKSLMRDQSCRHSNGMSRDSWLEPLSTLELLSHYFRVAFPLPHYKVYACVPAPPKCHFFTRRIFLQKITDDFERFLAAYVTDCTSAFDVLVPHARLEKGGSASCSAASPYMHVGCSHFPIFFNRYFWIYSSPRVFELYKN